MDEQGGDSGFCVAWLHKRMEYCWIKQYDDWENEEVGAQKESARASMRKVVKRLLKRHRYPPEGMEDAIQTVMGQCEIWTDNGAFV